MNKLKTLVAASAASLMSGAAIAEDAEKTIPGSIARVSPALQAYATDGLVGKVWADETLSTRDRSLVTIAALMTRTRPTDWISSSNWPLILA